MICRWKYSSAFKTKRADQSYCGRLSPALSVSVGADCVHRMFVIFSSCFQNVFSQNVRADLVGYWQDNDCISEWLIIWWWRTTDKITNRRPYHVNGHKVFELRTQHCLFEIKRTTIALFITILLWTSGEWCATQADYFSCLVLYVFLLYFHPIVFEARYCVAKSALSTTTVHASLMTWSWVIVSVRMRSMQMCVASGIACHSQYAYPEQIKSGPFSDFSIIIWQITVTIIYNWTNMHVQRSVTTTLGHPKKKNAVQFQLMFIQL